MIVCIVSCTFGFMKGINNAPRRLGRSGTRPRASPKCGPNPAESACSPGNWQSARAAGRRPAAAESLECSCRAGGCAATVTTGGPGSESDAIQLTARVPVAQPEDSVRPILGEIQVMHCYSDKYHFRVGRRFAAALLPRLFGTNPRSHHKGATGRVRTGDQRLPVLCHSQLGQDIPGYYDHC